MAADLQIFDVKIFCCNDSVFGKYGFILFYFATPCHINDMVYSILYQYDRTGLAPGWITNFLKICWKVRLFTNEKFRYSKAEWWKGSLQFLKWISRLKIISNEGDSTTHMLSYWLFTLSYIESQNVYRWNRFFLLTH